MSSHPLDVQAAVNILEDGYAPSTIRLSYDILGRALRVARAHGLVAEIVTYGVEVPTAAKPCAIS